MDGQELSLDQPNELCMTLKQRAVLNHIHGVQGCCGAAELDVTALSP